MEIAKSAACLYALKVKIVLLSLFIMSSCFGQKVLFKCVLKSNCIDTLVIPATYFLKKDSTTYSSIDQGPILTLPDTGTYIIVTSSAWGYEGLYSQREIHITKYGMNIDTLKKIDLQQVFFIDSKPKNVHNGDWTYCDQLSEGYHVDYYTNGNKYVEGTFKKGKPVGELRFYKESGELNYVEHYNRRGKKMKF